MPSHRKLALLICSIAFLLGLANPVSAASVTHRCASVDACIAAAFAAAKKGDHVAGLTAMNRLGRFPAMPKPKYREKRKEIIAAGDPNTISRAFVSALQPFDPSPPEIMSALAFHYRQLKRYDDAERVLRNAIASEPYHAPLWDALATTLAVQGKHDDAVGALLLAHEWAQAPDEVLATYELAAQSGQTMYQEASRLIRANLAAQAAHDGSLPPVPETQELRGTVHVSLDNKPNWPKSSLRLEEEGTVTLAFFVDANGVLLRGKKLKSSGIVALDNAALSGLAGGDFHPAVKDGKNQPSWVQVDYVWRFED